MVQSTFPPESAALGSHHLSLALGQASPDASFVVLVGPAVAGVELRASAAKRDCRLDVPWFAAAEPGEAGSGPA